MGIIVAEFFESALCEEGIIGIQIFELLFIEWSVCRQQRGVLGIDICCGELWQNGCKGI